MSHAAVLLAGGNSSRMGRDKSALPVDGVPLWQRQLATLRGTEPTEIFISGKCDGPYAGCGVQILADEFPGCGPLSGIATVLRRCTSDRLLVLAVDMPAMTAEFLRTLVELAQRTAKGIIPSVAAVASAVMKGSASHLEPLAAVYPRSALIIADEWLRTGERKLETFVHALESRGLASILPVAAAHAGLFANWNTPGDVPLPQAG
jgi:molybdopterin-guanine dinucleotide biosynthesis protein A